MLAGYAGYGGYADGFGAYSGMSGMSGMYPQVRRCSCVVAVMRESGVRNEKHCRFKAGSTWAGGLQLHEPGLQLAFLVLPGAELWQRRTVSIGHVIVAIVILAHWHRQEKVKAGVEATDLPTST